MTVEEGTDPAQSSRRPLDISTPLFLGKALDTPLSSSWRPWFYSNSLKHERYRIDCRGENDHVTNVTNKYNKSINTRYNIFTFIPFALAEQFSDFQNVFYLAVGLSQFIPILQIGPLFTYLVPLGFVIGMSMLREFLDEVHRWYLDRRRDREQHLVLHYVDSAERRRFERDLSTSIAAGFFGGLKGMVVAIKSSRSSLEVGDIIYVKTGSRMPADCLFMLSENAKELAYIRTEELDGEREWKVRHPVATTRGSSVVQFLESFTGTILYERPNDSIDSFTGELYPSGVNSPTDVEALTISNFLPADSTVMDGPIIAMVLYTGKETRISMSSTTRKLKHSPLERELNEASKLLFFVLSAISLLLTSAQTGLVQLTNDITDPVWWRSLLIHFLRYFLLLSSILPISMRVNLDFAKIVYSHHISWDPLMLGKASVRSSNTIETLGAINLVLSDKTGTMTNNKMTLRRIVVNLSGHLEDGTPDRLNKDIGPLDDVYLTELLKGPLGRTGALIALGLCHNVERVKVSVEARENSDDILFDGGSPDEIAFAEALHSLGIELLCNDGTRTIVQLPNVIHQGARYPVLHLCFNRILEIPFDSASKMMTVVMKLTSIKTPQGIEVLHNATVPVMIYSKGADESILPKCSGSWGYEESTSFATMGLRTMALAAHYVPAHVWDRENLTTSVLDKMSSVERSQHLIHLFGAWESLGITGVEDHLQAGCRETIEALYVAGCKVWMLTGDKPQTASCIGRTCGLILDHTSVIHVPSDVKSQTEFTSFLKHCSMDTRIDTCVLVMDSTNFNRYVSLKLHASTLLEFRSLILSRLSPKNKADIARFYRSYKCPLSHAKLVTTLAIGDGGNDVPMILESDVGVGLDGREGSQASLSGDISISKFEHLQPLLLWHGRNATDRSLKLSSFIIHRGLIFAFVQALYCALLAYVPLPIYQGWLCVGYATFFTMFPVFCLVLGSDVTKEESLSRPSLYLRPRLRLGATSIFGWLRTSLFQAFIIMTLACMLFDSNIAHLVSITFTSLVLVELLNVVSECGHLSAWMVLAQLFSVAVYLTSMKLLPQSFDSEFVWTKDFLIKVFVITIFSWLPVHVYTASKATSLI